MPSTKRGSGEAGKPTAKKATATARSARPRKAPAAGSKLTVKQVKSGIGHAQTYRRTLEALGLRHHQQTITVVDNPSVRGMLFKVRHLVEVSPVQEG
jgi:large subunit ribosomal protein L30